MKGGGSTGGIEIGTHWAATEALGGAQRELPNLGRELDRSLIQYARRVGCRGGVGGLEHDAGQGAELSHDGVLEAEEVLLRSCQPVPRLV
jgi:hypothetical protein